MTVIVGLRCADGVVIGADSSATFGPNMMMKTIEQAVQKVFVIENRYLLAGTGEIGLCQRFAEVIRQAHLKNTLKGSHVDIGKIICQNAREDFASTGVQEGRFGGLVAYPIHKETCLCEFAVKDLQPEWKEGKMWFSSMGSGQAITDPFLGLLRKVFFPETVPSVTEGIFIAMWALQHAIELNPGGINGPAQIAVLRNTDGKPEAKLLDDSELQEHIANVAAAEAHLAKYKDILRGVVPADAGTLVDEQKIPPAPPEES
jgi:20S proteasome alpha/beta subunit